MKRITYLLRDVTGVARARVIAGENETVTLEPWMIQNVTTRGWVVERWVENESGIEVHGWADWQQVSDRLAAALRTLLNDEPLDEDHAEQYLDMARAALEQYEIAQMEVAVALPDASKETPEEGDSDGSPAEA